MHISDLEVFRNLFSDGAELVCIIDANGAFAEHATTEFRVFKTQKAIADFISAQPSEKYLVFNFSEEELNGLLTSDNVVAILSWVKLNKTGQVFYYINNPDGTARWIFPSQNKYPSFLSLYNGAGFKSKILQFIVKMAYQFGLKKLISHGSFHFYTSKESSQLAILEDTKYEQYSIFTGTVGANRKMIVELTNNKQTTHFLKIPMTSDSNLLVENEFQQLKALGGIDWKKIRIPEVKVLNKGIQLSNVKPAKGVNYTNLTAVHIDALFEMYSYSAASILIDQLDFYKEGINNLKRIENIQAVDNGLSENKIERIIESLTKMIDGINPNQKIPVALAHGDFTPWNMYVEKESLFVYDWELAKSKMPIFYDAIHFVFQSNTLIHQSAYKDIKEQLNDFVSQAKVANYIEEHQINFESQYRCYLLFTVTYYLRKYITQKPLHEQVHWLINNWIEAINDVNSFSTNTAVLSHTHDKKE